MSTDWLPRPRAAQIELAKRIQDFMRRSKKMTVTIQVSV